MDKVVDKKTKEPQYNEAFDVAKKHGISRFSLMANQTWNQDPKRTLFTLSRYKFVARMLDGIHSVLEIGCADAFGTRIVQQAVGKITAIDFDPIFIDDIKDRFDPNWPMDFFVHDILTHSVPGRYDAAYALDVLEHIHPDHEDKFFINIIESLSDNGILIIGMPSLEAQKYASWGSKEGHVNCKMGLDLKRRMYDYFENVFLFGMNDEVLHTGFPSMCHYIFTLATCKKKK